MHATKDEIERLIRDGTLRKFTRKERDEGMTDLEMRNSSNPDNKEPLVVIHVIIGGPSSCKGKNKLVSKDVLLVKKDTWEKQEVTFNPNDRMIEPSHNDPLVVSIR